MDREKWVKTNNYEAVLEVTEKLLHNGYEDFIMLSADPSILSTRQERTRGFQDALQLANKKCVTKIVKEDVTHVELSEMLMHELKLSSRTLVFVANCWLLPIVYMALKDFRNLIPKTIGLLGFDNLEWSNFSSPTVTTIVQPAYEEGKAAAEILIDALECTHELAPNQILPCAMNWCESTGMESSERETQSSDGIQQMIAPNVVNRYIMGDLAE